MEAIELLRHAVMNAGVSDVVDLIRHGVYSTSIPFLRNPCQPGKAMLPAPAEQV